MNLSGYVGHVYTVEGSLLRAVRGLALGLDLVSGW